MKVLEIKNNLVKIEYKPEDNLLLSGFVIIEDFQSPYVAQVLSLKADNGMNYAIVKLLFTFNDEGIVKNYDGTIPSLEADVSRLGSDELLDILPINTPVEIGTIAHQGINLKVDMSIFEKNLLICSDNTEDSNIVIENSIYQLNENNCKTIVFDTNGSYAGNKFVFGRDFKLPLNYETINYIYEHDLANVDPQSKAIIQEIFLEVQEYSKTVLDKFIPFETFLAVVDQQYKALGIPELVLLKNKLLRYQEMNVFAQSPKEIQNLRSAIRADITTTLDISTAEDVLQNEIIKYVYNTIDEMDLFVYAFVNINNENADKKLIRHLLSKNKIHTITVCSHNFKYIYELKERANNLILFAPQVIQHDFSAYNTFLNKLNPDEFIIYGKATQNIPLIVELASMLGPEEEEPVQSPTETAEVVQEEVQQDDFSDESNSYSYETLIEDTAQQNSEEEVQPEGTLTADETPATEENSEETSEEETLAEPSDENTEETAQEEFDEQTHEEDTVETDEIDENDDIENEEEDSEEGDYSDETDEVEEEVSEEEPIDTETISNIIDKEIEAEIYTDPSNDEIIDGEFHEINDTSTPESFVEGSQTEETTEQQVDLPPIEEVIPDSDFGDASINNIFSDETQNNEPAEDFNENPQENIQEETQEELTEDDLNFIQDVNSPVIEEGSLPVYPAQTTANDGEVIEFAAGDHVSHPKYGEGIVEKMIRYGSKSLCSISFVNIGRRLLDPAISEITKLA